MAAARYFFAGVKLLLQGGYDVAIACAHLAAQSLECVLKAYLSKVGIPVIDLKNRYAHDLQSLCVEAVAKGLTESPQPPDWCVILNQTHNKPYHLRYPLDINGFSIPAFSVVVPALSRLIDQVGSYRIASKRNIANRMTEQIGKSRKL